METLWGFPFRKSPAFPPPPAFSPLVRVVFNKHRLVFPSGFLVFPIFRYALRVLSFQLFGNFGPRAVSPSPVGISYFLGRFRSVLFPSMPCFFSLPPPFPSFRLLLTSPSCNHILWVCLRPPSFHPFFFTFFDALFFFPSFLSFAFVLVGYSIFF